MTKRNTKKRFVFEFDSLQMALFFAGALTICLLAFAIGLQVGVKKGKLEFKEAALKKDLRYKIKAPSLLSSNKKKNKLKSTKKPAPSPAPSIETVIAASAEKKSVKKIVRTSPSTSTSKKAVKPTVKESELQKKGRYFIQVAAFRDAADAENEASKLNKKGYKTLIVKAEIPNKGTYHRVRLGPFTSLKKAKSFAAKLEKKENISTYIAKD